jgi:hypothetical protein
LVASLDRAKLAPCYSFHCFVRLPQYLNFLADRAQVSRAQMSNETCEIETAAVDAVKARADWLIIVTFSAAALTTEWKSPSNS